LLIYVEMQVYGQLNYVEYLGQKVWEEIIYIYVVDIVQEDSLHV